MKFLALAVCLAASPALAATLDGPAITAALSGQSVTYDDGATQTFDPKGATTYDNGRPSSGSWSVRGDQYCSVWPPSDRWACYDVTLEGDRITFTGADGSLSAGRLAP